MGPVPKGLKDSARGFNPGLLTEKNRPNGAAESNAGPDEPVDTGDNVRPKNAPSHSLSCHPSRPD